MKLYLINVGNFKLDGGAMFGVVPKSIWNKTNPADKNNMIDIASRCLLIEDGNRLILIDTGMGTKQSERFFNYYCRWGTDSLDVALATHGFCREDVTDVFLTHLHFDHCGGCVQWNSDKTAYEIAFKNATFWSNEDHWKWATNPNKRERASFLTEDERNFLENERKQQEETAKMRNDDYQLSYALDVLKGLATLSQN